MNIIADFHCNVKNYTAGRKESIKYAAIHYVGAEGTAKQNAKYFANSNVGASAHYYVGHKAENGKIYKSVDESNTAWHCGARKYYNGCRNANSIGVELCCHKDSNGIWYFDDETIATGVELVKDIMKRHNISIDHVVRHYDVTRKICPEPFVRDEAAWNDFKAKLVNEPTVQIAPSETKQIPAYDFASLQRLVGAKDDNIPGPKTLEACSKHVLKKKTIFIVKDSIVLWVQTRLNYLGFNCGTPDGKFGKNTEKAVKDFQTAKGLKADGIVGPKTWEKLLGL